MFKGFLSGLPIELCHQGGSLHIPHTLCLNIPGPASKQHRNHRAPQPAKLTEDDLAPGRGCKLEQGSTQGVRLFRSAGNSRLLRRWTWLQGRLGQTPKLSLQTAILLSFSARRTRKQLPRAQASVAWITGWYTEKSWLHIRSTWCKPALLLCASIDPNSEKQKTTHLQDTPTAPCVPRFYTTFDLPERAIEAPPLVLLTEYCATAVQHREYVCLCARRICAFVRALLIGTSLAGPKTQTCRLSEGLVGSPRSPRYKRSPNIP